MPSGSQLAMTLSFSKKNKDIHDKLQEKKNKGENASEYVCTAIRFYETYGNKISSNLNKEEIEQIVNDKFDQLKRNLLEELKFSNTIKSNTNSNEYLERDLNGISTDDD